MKASRLVLLDLLEDIFAVISNSNSRGHYQSLQAVWKDKVCRIEVCVRSDWISETRCDLGQLLMPAVYEAALAPLLSAGCSPWAGAERFLVGERRY